MSWLATSALVAGALFIGMAALMVNDAMRAKLRVRRRMRTIADLLDAEGAAPVAEVAPETRTENETYIVVRLDTLFPLSGGVRTGMIVIVTTLVLWIVLVPAMIFVGVPTIFATILSLAAAVTFGWNAGSAVEARKRDAFCNRLVTAVEDFQRLVRFGTSSLRALRSVAQTAEEPLVPSLRAILRETDFGVPLEQAMAREAHRIRMGELAMLSAIISAQSGTGGSLSEAVGTWATCLGAARFEYATQAATASSK